jgi:hypothetical protein
MLKSIAKIFWWVLVAGWTALMFAVLYVGYVLLWGAR